jgi:hypothetical protein
MAKGFLKSNVVGLLSLSGPQASFPASLLLSVLHLSLFLSLLLTHVHMHTSTHTYARTIQKNPCEHPSSLLAARALRSLCLCEPGGTGASNLRPPPLGGSVASATCTTRRAAPAVSTFIHLSHTSWRALKKMTARQLFGHTSLQHLVTLSTLLSPTVAPHEVLSREGGGTRSQGPDSISSCLYPLRFAPK